MKYNQLGKTGLKVSALSYGASPLGGVFHSVREDEGVRTVHTAIDLGINYIDCSPYYGLTKAETLLGKALRGIGRDQYILATKVGRYGDDEFDFSAKRVTRSVDESLQRLQVDHVDIIQCHDIEFGSIDQVVNEGIPALYKLREQGKIRFVGITGLPLKLFRTVLDQIEVDAILSYCHYALNDVLLVDWLPYLQQKNVGVISASPLSMGLLTDVGPPDWHPAPQEICETCAKAAAFCRDKGANIAKLALQYALQCDEIHTTLVGTARVENIERNVEWMNEPLDEELLQEVLAILKPIHNQTWPSGREENN
ncbi:MAG: aldo/keto reductase [Candidatus Hinthialibacter antarcticus]|nr:aldo/keto reductase [Candidatus Hinthialibacter antarcticus]